MIQQPPSLINHNIPIRISACFFILQKAEKLISFYHPVAKPCESLLVPNAARVMVAVRHK